MARDDNSVWHTLGRTVEEVKGILPSGAGSKKSKKRSPGTFRLPEIDHPVSGVLAGAVGALLSTSLRRWLGSKRPSPSRLLRGAAAGAGAAGILYGLRSVLYDNEGRELLDELLAGAGKGVVYAALLEPLLPGPPALRGAAAGTAEYLAAPWGGIFSQLQSLSPARRIPVVSILLEAGDAEDDPYLTFLLYGLAVGLLYGEPPDRD